MARGNVTLLTASTRGTVARLRPLTSFMARMSWTLLFGQTLVHRLGSVQRHSELQS